MDKVGVRELKNHTSRIVRSVREEMAEYIVTVHGKPVAVLRPVSDDDLARLNQAEVDEALAKIDALAARVTAAWQSPKSAVELIEDQRR